MKTFFFACLCSIFLASAMAQENEIKRISYFTAGFIQVKESSNFGLVFRGPGIKYGMAWDFMNEKRIITYEFGIGFGAPFSKGMESLSFYLKPIDFSYLFKIPIGENKLWLGPNLRLVYDYYYYPELQSAFDYWFTNFSIGADAKYGFTKNNSDFVFKLETSVFGFASRQPNYREPYYYDIGFQYAVQHLNQGLAFGSVNEFISANFEFTWKPNKHSRCSYAYQLHYSGYYQSPEIQVLTNSIKLIIGTKQK